LNKIDEFLNKNNKWYYISRLIIFFLASSIITGYMHSDITYGIKNGIVTVAGFTMFIILYERHKNKKND
jgi:uncharacterized membrane protein YhhN